MHTSLPFAASHALLPAAGPALLAVSYSTLAPLACPQTRRIQESVAQMRQATANSLFKFGGNAVVELVKRVGGPPSAIAQVAIRPCGSHCCCCPAGGTFTLWPFCTSTYPDCTAHGAALEHSTPAALCPSCSWGSPGPGSSSATSPSGLWGITSASATTSESSLRCLLLVHALLEYNTNLCTLCAWRHSPVPCATPGYWVVCIQLSCSPFARHIPG